MSEYQEQLREKQRLRDFKLTMTKFIMTSRFNNSTWSENEQYRERLNHTGCIYCCPVAVTQRIPYESIMFVLEMNNDTNKIVGIGMVKNRAIREKYKVYEDGNFCGIFFKEKAEVDPIPEELINKKEDEGCRVF